MKSFPSIEEFSAAAKAAIESGDPADRDKFTEATGMLPYAFQAQLQTLGDDQLLRALKAHVAVAGQRQQDAQATLVRYVSKPLQAHQSTHPYGVFDQVSRERIFAGKQSDCGRLAGLMQSAFEAGIGHAQTSLARLPVPGPASLPDLIKTGRSERREEAPSLAR